MKKEIMKKSIIKYFKRYIAFLIILILIISTICYATPENKLSEIYNNKPKTDLKASANSKKKLDIVAVTDLTGQKLTDFKNKVANLKANLFYKDIDMQVNYIDENTLKQADVYRANKISYYSGYYYDAKLNQDGTITFYMSGGLYGAYPNAGDPLTIAAPAGTFKIGSTGAAVFALTKDGNLYYTGSLQFTRSDYGVIWGINPSFTGFKLWSTGVKDFIATNQLAVVLKKDGTVWWSGIGYFGGGYNKLINGGIAVMVNDRMAGRDFPGYTTTLEQIQGLKGITRIYAKYCSIYGFTAPSVIAINDNTGEVYGWGANTGQFGWHTPEYDTISSYFYSGLYWYNYHQPLERTPKLIDCIDGRTIRDWILEDGFSYIYKKDNSLWKIDDNGFDLIYTETGFIGNLPKNPYGQSINWPGDEITPGTIYPATLTKIAQLPSNVLRINHVGNTTESVNTGYDTFELYLDDSKVYTCNIPKNSSDPNYLNYSLLSSSSNYKYKSTYSPDTFAAYDNPDTVALKALDIDKIKNISYRDSSDKIFLYVSENADTSNVYGGQVNVKTDITGSVSQTENFDDAHTLSVSYANCSVVTDGDYAGSGKSLYGIKTSSSAPTPTVDITINVPDDAYNPVLSLTGYYAGIYIDFNGNRTWACNYLKQQKYYYSLKKGINTFHIEAYYQPRSGSKKSDDYTPEYMGNFYIDDINVSYTRYKNNQYGYGSYFPLLDISKDVLSYLADKSFKFYYVTPTAALDFLESYYGNQKYTLRQLGSVSDTMNIYSQQDDALQAIYNAYVKNNTESNHIYVIANEEKVNYNKVYSDYESDPQKQERWKYEHNPTYFENSNGTATFNNQWLSSPITEFDKVGRYTVTYQAQDAPTNETAFDNYNLWSTDEKQLIIDVHRRPIADFTYDTPTNTTITDTTTKAEDFDSTHSLAYSVYNASVQGGGGVNNSKCLYAYNSNDYAYIQFQVEVPYGVTNARVSFDAKGYMYYIQLDGSTVINEGYNTVTDFKHYEINVVGTGTHTILIKTNSQSHGNKEKWYEYGNVFIDNIVYTYSETNPAKTLTFTNLSYDLDHLSETDKGIKAVQWKWRNINDTSWNNGLPTYIRNKDIYVVYLAVQDAEGAWSVPCIKVINGSAPTLTINPLSMDWINQNVTVTLTAKDNSQNGLKTLKYAVTSSVEKPSSWATKTYNEYTANDTVSTTISSEGIWYVHGEVEDCDDNSIYKRGGPYKIDKTPPTIIANPTSGEFEEETDIAVGITDNLSGVKEAWYRWTTSSSSISDLTGFTKFTASPIKTPSEGTYYLHIKAYDNAGNVNYKIFGPYVVDELSVSASVAPNPAKRGQKVVFTINTKGYAKYLKITFPPEIWSLDMTTPINLTIPEQSNRMDYVPYYLPLKTSTTLNDNGRLRQAYIIQIEAKKSNGKTKTTTVNLDVKGSILDGIKTEIKCNY